MEETVILNVLDCNFWKKGQCIIKISSQDYTLVDRRSRLMKRSPEYWIFINMGEIEEIPIGNTKFYVKDNNGRKTYSIFPDSHHEICIPIYICESHLFRCSDGLKILFCEKCGKVKYL